MGTPKAKMALQPDPSSCDRANALYMAKLSEQAERYDDMVKYMKRIVSLGVKGDELSVEERNLLSVGYKRSVFSSRRWRVTTTVTELRSARVESVTNTARLPKRHTAGRMMMQRQAFLPPTLSDLDLH